MTVVIGYLDNSGTGHICTDSMASDGHTRENSNFNKILNTKDGNLLMGTAGSFLSEQLQFYNFLGDDIFELVGVDEKSNSPLYIKAKNIRDEEYFYMSFRYNLRSAINDIVFKTEIGATSNINNSIGTEADTDIGTYIVAHENLMYTVYTDTFTLIPVSKGSFAVIGSGSSVAKGAMNIINSLKLDSLSPKQKLIEAVKAVSTSVTSVGGETIYYANTRDYIIEEIPIGNSNSNSNNNSN